MTDEILSILEPFVAKAQKLGADEVEFFAQRDSNKVVNFESNNLKSAEASDVDGVGIRVLINKAIGFASVNSFDKAKITTSLKEAIAIAKIAPPEDYYYLPDKQQITSIPDLYDKNIESFSMDDIISNGQALLKSATEYDKRVSVDSGSFSARIRTNALVNSNGISISEKKSYLQYNIFGMAIDGDDVGSFDYDYDSLVKVKDIDVVQTGETFAKKTLSMLGAQKTESFEGTMILPPEVAGDLLSLLLYSVIATNIQSGASYLQDKLGEKIAVDHFSMYDNGTLKNNTGSSSFDREGVPRKQLNIVDKGTFTGVLYDTFTANKEKLPSTGHASGSFRNIPGISPTNLFVEPGKTSIDDIISEIKDGIIIQRMSAMPDPVAGDFSGVIKGGKLIKNGEQVKTLKEITAVGNVFECLKNITHISKEFKPLRGGQNWFLPYLVIDGIKFVS
ncbi:MAG: TldD/PmbA family protein [Asgard group archaeon]|nr:TldD/PmbA family protein [Asgard group archaeon]